MRAMQIDLALAQSAVDLYSGQSALTLTYFGYARDPESAI
jgi:hypothetical protein